MPPLQRHSIAPSPGYGQSLATGRAPQSVVYLPMIGRKSFWTVFLDPVTAEVLAYMPLDSF